MELQVGNVIMYEGRKYKVVSRKQQLIELRQLGFVGLFKQNRQIFVRRSTKYYLIKR